MSEKENCMIESSFENTRNEPVLGWMAAGYEKENVLHMTTSQE